jgi:ABC-type nitrate/sulfonate/bicarbonate transport system substrate-binding protein
METKQTTVQWLLEQYLKKDGLTQSDVKRALEMEKQQIIDASSIAYEDMFGTDGTEYGEEYYNKIFNKK